MPLLGVPTTTMLRISIAAIILSLIWHPWKIPLNKNTLRAVLPYGVCLGIMNLTFYLALSRVPLGICVALEFTGPLSVALISSRKKIDFLWAFLAILGVALVLPLNGGEKPVDGIGIALSLFAGLCWALYIIFGKRAGSRVPSGVATT